MKKTKKFKLKSVAANGAAKGWTGNMVQVGTDLFPRDPSYKLEWQGKHLAANATEQP